MVHPQPLPYWRSYSTFRSPIPWTFWKLPNLIPCGRLLRRTFKSFGISKTARTVSTERDKLENLQTPCHAQSNGGYQCCEQTCEIFRNVSIEKMREGRGTKRKGGAEIGEQDSADAVRGWWKGKLSQRRQDSHCSAQLPLGRSSKRVPALR